MSYLRSFMPWIVFAAVPSSDWKMAALAALGTSILLMRKDRRAGVTADAQVLEVSTAAYFAALSALAYADPQSPLHAYTGALSFAWLAMTALATLVVRRPFTLGIARRSTPREYWNTPMFLRVNTVITSVWAASFTATAVALAACDATGAGSVTKIACQATGFILPMLFTREYPKAVQSRRVPAHAR